MGESCTRARAPAGLGASQDLSVAAFASSSDEQSSEPTAAVLPPSWRGRGSAGRARQAAGSAEGRRRGEHPPPGSLVLLIPANCTSQHRAMGEVTPWPGMEQLRDLLLLKPGESSALPGFYFIWTELRIRQIILLSSVNVLLLQESWM